MKNMIFILVMFISLFLSIYYVRQILTDDSTNLKTKKKEIMGAIFSVTGVIIGLIGLIVPIDKNESVEKRTNNDERQKIEQEFSNNEKIDVINNNSGMKIIMIFLMNITVKSLKFLKLNKTPNTLFHL